MPPAGHYDPAASCSLYWPAYASVQEARPMGTESATVERREAGAPRKVRTTPQQRGWSRFASAAQFAPSRRSAPVWGEGKKRETRRRARDFSGQAKRWLGLFDIVR